MSEKVIGIDLGTTNSCVAILENGRPTVIANQGGYKITPSVVAFTDNNQRIVGHLAKRQAISNPENTVFAFKRLIGRKWESPEVKRSQEICSYKIVKGPHQDVRVSLQNTEWSIPQISSWVLLEMKKIAETYLKQPVNKVVITVPAYFNDSQRQATKDAGEIAGLEVLRIINEPTSAALAYGYGKATEKRIVVYDLGGGTFDISILEISNGVFEVVCTAGDTFLGGEDFDACIIDHISEEYLAQNPGVDLRKDKMALQRMKEAAEKAKIDLSSVEKTEISLPFIYSDASGSKHLRTTLTRQTFETLIAILIDKTVKMCRDTLGLSNLSISQIDDLLLVGGSTRIPLVQKKVAEFFGRQANKGVNPDEVVAVGAAVQAASLVDSTIDTLLLDVTPLSLGIKTKGGLFTTLINKNTRIPTQHSHIFTTVEDNQKAVKISVHQGEDRHAEGNELLGEFLLEGIAPATAGRPEIEVSFAIDNNGIVNVSAVDLATKKSQSITVTASTGLTPEEKQRMTDDNKSFEVDDKENQVNLEKAHELGTLLRDVEAMLSEKFLSVEESLQNKTVTALNAAKKAVREHDEAAMKTCENTLIDLKSQLDKTK